MQTIITYGSVYGSAEHYACKFAELTGFSVFSYKELKRKAKYDRIIHFGALYAGGITGIKHILNIMTDTTELVVVTVGLADVTDPENICNIRKRVTSQIPKKFFCRTRVFHLRGAIDYGCLGLKHRTMMSMLYAKAKNMPQENKNAETRAMIETYGKAISFIDDTALKKLKDSL